MDSRGRALDDLPDVARLAAIVLSFTDTPPAAALTLKAVVVAIAAAVLVGVLVFALTGTTL